jgi:glycosyltransferase involved in cell wall biosynthesis
MLEYRQGTDDRRAQAASSAQRRDESTRASATSSASEAPSVSVVVPCFNEERFIGEVLENLARQGDAGQFEIIVVDGMSTDGTRAVVERFIESHPKTEVRLVENPARHIPAALNRGIEAARGRVIARMDAHAVPSADYLRDCLEQLCREDVAVVGMPCRIRPGADTAVARANAVAVAHPFGIGDAKYRTAAGGASASRFVDTVPFGVFTKELWRRLGGYNEELLTNEDYDFNYRVRRDGGGVLLDTSGYCTYFARPTFAALTRQYFRYGLWKAQMVKLHPRSIRLRQLVAPVFICALVVFGALSLWLTPVRWMFALVVAAYAALALASALQLARREGEWKLLPLVPASFLLIHVAWGGGFLLGLLRAPR